MRIQVTDQQAQEKAVQLGLIQPGEPLPQHLRGRVVADIVQEQAAERPAPRAEPRLAGEIVIQPDGDILVDGEPFPWLVARDRIEVVVDPDGPASTVRLTLLAERVRITEPQTNESE